MPHRTAYQRVTCFVSSLTASVVVRGVVKEQTFPVVSVIILGAEMSLFSVSHFTHDKSVEVRSPEPRNGAIESRAWLVAGMRDSCVLTAVKLLTFIKRQGCETIPY